MKLRRILSVARLSFPLASALAVLFSTPALHAAALTWDAGNTANGTTIDPLSGNWDTTAGNIVWNNAGTNVIWDQTSTTVATNSAIFGGTDGTLDQYVITLASQMATSSLTFNNSGYKLTGSTIYNTSGNTTVAAGKTATISSILAGTAGLTKLGSGALTLNGSAANTFTGGLNVNLGTLTLDFTNLATPTNFIAASNALQINNGTLTITGKNIASATTAQTFASTSLGAGVNTVNIAKGALATSGTLNLGALTVAPGSVTAFSPTTAWTTTASTTERIFITAGGSVPTLPGSGSLYINGLFHRTGASAGAVRWAAVNSSGQLLAGTAITNLLSSTGSTPTTPVQFQGSSSLALTNTAVSTYGLLLNTTSNGLTLTLAAAGTYTLNSIIQQQSANAVTIAPGTGASNLIIGSERNLVINMDNSAGVSINAPIANNGGGASSVTIASTAPSGTTPGSVTFGGANTYTGATYIANGSLSLANANPLGTTPGTNGTSGISIYAGAVLSSATTGTNPSTTIAAPITLSGTGNSTIRIGQGVASNTHTFNINGAIGGTTGNLVYTTTTNSFNNGSSVFVLGAAGTYAGNTNITTGNGGNNPVTVRSGIANALPSTTVLTMTGGSAGGSGRALTFDLNGFDQTLAGLTHTLTIPNDRQYRVSSTGAATLTINNSADFSFGGATKDPDVAPTANPGTVTSAQITGAISLVKNGAGTFTLGGTLTNGATAQGNTFTGDTKILGGILVLGESTSLRNSAFDTGASIAGNAANGLRTTVTTLTLGGLKGGNDFSTSFTSTTGGYTGITALTLNPGTGVTNSYSADIGNGAGGMTLTKTGLGTQVLTNTQTYTGATTITAGTLQLDGSTHASSTVGIGTAGTLTGSGTVNGNATLTGGGIINKSAGTIAGTLGVTGGNWNGAGDVTGLVTSSSGILNIGSGANLTANSGLSVTGGSITASDASSTITGSVDYTSGTSSSFAGIITGSSKTLTMNNAAASLTLSGTNTYTGGTTISAGTLQLGAGSTTGSLSTSSVIVNNGNLTINRSNAVAQGTDFSGADIIGTGSFTQAGTGTTTLNVANSYSGGTTVSAGTLALSNNSAAGTAGIAVSGASAAILQIDAGITLANNITFSNTNAASSVKHDVVISGTYSTGTTGNLTSSFAGGQADTTAQILGGTSTVATTLEMLFKDTSAATNDAIRRSDVFTTAGTSTDTYVIQLSTGALAADSVLAWLNGSNQWVHAGTTFFNETYSFAARSVGDYGYDSGNVWAVVDHSGSFAAVPEPTSAFVGLLIGAGLLRRRRSTHQNI